MRIRINRPLCGYFQISRSLWGYIRMRIRINQPLMIITYNNNSKEIDNQENDNQEKKWGQQQLTLWQRRQRHLVHEWVRHAKCTWSIWIYVHCTRNKKLTLWANQKVYFVHWTEYVLVLYGPLYGKHAEYQVYDTTQCVAHWANQVPASRCCCWLQMTCGRHPGASSSRYQLLQYH